MNWTSAVCLCLLVHLGQHSTPVASKRTRHSKSRRHDGTSPHDRGHEVTAPAAPPPVVLSKKRECGLRLPQRCNCSRNNPVSSNPSLSIFCQNINLTEIPAIDYGSNIVQELHLENNRLTSINIGTFFGVKVVRLLLANNTLSTLDFLTFWGLEFHLVTLDLSYNLFTEVPEPALKLLRSLRTLVLSGNAITTLGDLNYLPKLEVLILDDNPITSIAEQTFLGTRLSQLSLNSIKLSHGLDSFLSGQIAFLAGLSMANNKLQTVPSNCLSSFRYLRILNLSNNSLHELPSDALDGAKLTLARLELDRNYFTRVPGTVTNLANLKILELNDNMIGEIEDGTFATLAHLEKLGLRNNQISSLGQDALRGLESVTTVDLRDNNIVTLSSDTFYWSKPSDRVVLLAGNSFLCNCELKWLKKVHKGKSQFSRMFKDAESLMCERPFSLEGMPIVYIHLRRFTCDHDYYYYYSDLANQESDTYYYQYN